MGRMCGDPMVSNLYSLLSKEDLMVGLRRKEQGNLMNQKIVNLVSPSNAMPVVN